MSGNKATDAEQRRAAIVMFGTAIIIFAAAGLLWCTGDEKARGASVALVAAGSAHLIKEATGLIKAIMNP
jgi:hypothetical protein